jgi:hypothetical protein
MIVRILGEGQFNVEDSAGAELGRLDAELATAVERDDEAVFSATLSGLVALVHKSGTLAPADSLEPSDLILPREGATMDEVRKLLTDEGLISG